jgi:hypothetical protein
MACSNRCSHIYGGLRHLRCCAAVQLGSGRERSHIRGVRRSRWVGLHAV